eukprot:SAG22_NODE_976_length_6199_cov_1.414426_6_plen_222_part_00
MNRPSGCGATTLSFPGSCTGAAPQPVRLAAEHAGPSQWLLQVAAGPTEPGAMPRHATNTDQPCADPFAWWEPVGAGGRYRLVCTGGLLAYSSSPTISSTAVFRTVGAALPAEQQLPPWAASGQRWAPEVGMVPTGDGEQAVIFFSDAQPEGPRRVGWAWATAGPGPGAWNVTAPAALDLGQAPAGEIDQHIFRSVGPAVLVGKHSILCTPSLLSIISGAHF